MLWARGAHMTSWQRWLQQPQRLWFRRALFQIHLWSGIAVGIYLILICITGSLLVYRNELSRAATPAPIIVAPAGPLLTPDELSAAATRAYPGFEIEQVFPQKNPNRAVIVSLKQGEDRRERLFHPYTGEDLGNSIPWGIRLLSWMLDLHDNLLFGETGRRVNGIGSLVLVVLVITGSVIWWPGAQNWRRSLGVHRNVSWKRFMWDFHSAVGFWSLVFVLLFGVTGAYLSYPNEFQAAADYIEPMTDENAGVRTVDTMTFWLARLHFGRFGGWSTKLAWAVLGLAPAALFVTGALMWWSRVLSKVVRGDLQARYERVG
jgi:uncharacterized iron-regulated membrane protein